MGFALFLVFAFLAAAAAAATVASRRAAPVLVSSATVVAPAKLAPVVPVAVPGPAPVVPRATAAPAVAQDPPSTGLTLPEGAGTIVAAAGAGLAGAAAGAAINELTGGNEASGAVAVLGGAGVGVAAVLSAPLLPIVAPVAVVGYGVARLVQDQQQIETGRGDAGTALEARLALAFERGGASEREAEFQRAIRENAAKYIAEMNAPRWPFQDDYTHLEWRTTRGIILGSPDGGTAGNGRLGFRGYVWDWRNGSVEPISSPVPVAVAAPPAPAPVTTVQTLAVQTRISTKVGRVVLDE